MESKNNEKKSVTNLNEFISTHKVLLGVIGAVIVAVCGVVAFLWNEQVKLAQDRVQSCESDNERIRKEKDEATSELSSLKLEMGNTKSKLDNLEEIYRELEIRCLPRQTSCLIPTVTLSYGTMLKGKANIIHVELKNSENSGSARLICAARVVDSEGQKSYWATNDVLPHRDGGHECTVFIGKRPSGGSILPVVLKEIKEGSVVTDEPLRRLGIDFEEICVMSKK